MNGKAIASVILGLVSFFCFMDWIFNRCCWTRIRNYGRAGTKRWWISDYRNYN